MFSFRIPRPRRLDSSSFSYSFSQYNPNLNLTISFSPNVSGAFVFYSKCYNPDFASNPEAKEITNKPSWPESDSGQGDKLAVPLAFTQKKLRSKRVKQSG
ncbi:hypothetical protein F2Q68_00016559 [Brassica cretica]|uniref:Uncharacterized protein n=1 Tax=Brassica cretica TaxID=69181 RepID=A0A8S9HJU1_BRACR|nr:hypothetical protein F2Q68_00016559 [Brassica cretica]